MAARTYTILIADQTTGVVRRLTIRSRALLAAVVALMLLPLLVWLGARRGARAEIAHLRSDNAELQVENGSYRGATGELTTQIQSLEAVIDELGVRASVDPAAAAAMQKLPAMIRTRAAGGPTEPTTMADVVASSFSSPEDTFGVLRDVLQALESRLRFVRRDVEQREALAAATPSIWPTQGWLTGSFGGRSDPFTGELGFHRGIDISTEKGRPVYATADGTVESATFTGDYGNLLVLQHAFGLTTRYAHLSDFAVSAGQEVKRGDVIGYVGTTGRSTGAHLHYEILVNGKLINPLQLLSDPARP